MTIITAFGSSTTYGAWDFEAGGWVSRLRKYTDRSQDLLYNMGVSGDTTVDILKRFKVECSATARDAIQYKEPFVLIISVGTNDSYLLNGKSIVTEKQFEANVKKIITLSKSYTNKIFFLEITPVDDKKTNPISWNKSICYKNSRILEYNQIVKRVCKEKRIKFITTNTRLGDYKDKLYDGLHLNSKGHKIIADAVKEALTKEKIISG